MTATLCVLALLAAGDGAQAAADPPRWDVAASTGLFNGHPRDDANAEFAEAWYHAPTLGITIGRYFTTNLKAEGELTVSGEGTRYVSHVVQVPEFGLRSISAEEMTRTTSASAAVVWQYFDNQWVHPFLMTGISVDFDREARHTWRQSAYRGDPRIPGNEIVLTEERTERFGTRTRPRALIGGGAKLYVGPRAFFRTDGRIAFGGDGGGNVSFRLGFGVDF